MAPLIFLATMRVCADRGAGRRRRQAAEPPLPPPPSVTYQSGAGAERVEHGERIVDVDAARKGLHAQHHPHGVLETRRLPGTPQAPVTKSVEELALPKEKLVVINPGLASSCTSWRGSGTVTRT